MDNFFDRTADVGSDEEEEFDEDGEPTARQSRPTNGDADDSSEEEDDDDEEEEQRIREGFIVDEDEDEEGARERRRERKKKRRREQNEEDELLDDEDLDLIGETHPDLDRRQAEPSKFKRLKRGHREDRSAGETRGIEDIFSDDDEGLPEPVTSARGRAALGYNDDLDDFIEQDEFPDEEGGRGDEELGIRAPRKSGFADLQNLKDSGLDEADLEDMRGAFGDGEEFGWALAAEAEHNEEQIDADKPLELKDVFEPSQLIEKMLTDDDNQIRATDVPERFQLARKPYKDISNLSEDEMKAREEEEAGWITNFLYPKKRLDPNLREPFQNAVRHVLHFMNVEDFEPAFIFQNRKDYLIHSEDASSNSNGRLGDEQDAGVRANKLLNQADLWEVLEQDLKFRAFAERREAILDSIRTLKDIMPNFNDTIFDDLLPVAAQIDDLHDLQEYLNFQYAAQLRDKSIAGTEERGGQKRARGTRSKWDRVRSSSVYHLVRQFGITADTLAQNAEKAGRRSYIDDPDKGPVDFADTLIQAPEFSTGEDVLNAAKAMYVEEMVVSPRMRRYLRKIYYDNLVFDVRRTEKGLVQIDEDHPYYEFKYLQNQEVRTFLVDRPELFLRMLKAEADGLVEVSIRLQGERKFKEELQRLIESDNFSEVADAWNSLRKEVLDVALKKLHKVISKGVKDNLKNECENKIAGYCRDAYTNKLDQAPWKPKGMELGTMARVLALSNGAGNRGDAVCWAYIDESGRVLENGKFVDLKLGADGKDVSAFVELVGRRKPDVVAVSGWSIETRRLHKELQDIISTNDLKGTPYEDDDGNELQDALDIVVVNDEVARLYHTSDRAATEHPGVPVLTRYAIGLARYMQSPLKEYAALGRDILSISFDPNQHLIPEDKLAKHLESAMVDIVNLVGVDINDAVGDSYTANLLPYVCGLGPRKAAQMLKIINGNGGEVANRNDLVGIERDLRQAVSPIVWTNCASFLFIPWDSTDDPVDSDYLDNTRIHPEDYDLARKIAADALELDEEDIKGEVEEYGPSAVVRKLVRDDQQDKVNDLVLEQYAEQLEKQMFQRKRATLELVRAELQNPYEELRRNFATLSSEEQFTMLTGETRETLQEGMVISVSVMRTQPDRLDVKLDCGVIGEISVSNFQKQVVARVQDGALQPRQLFGTHQALKAKLISLDRKRFSAELTLNEDDLRIPFRKALDRDRDVWDEELETRDKREAKKASENEAGRAQRVIKHPLFRPFNSAQAIHFLAGQARGDCVIRPSSKGANHLAVTWKVHDNIYQHIDVLELDKENEFSVGRTLKVGKDTYSDLDELIVLHVKAMAKKVDEMMGDEQYQAGTKEQTEQWLTTYTEANPKRSKYAFCLNPKYPGYFHLCFKAGGAAPLATWPVRVVPKGFELKGNKYPDMRGLKNGFKVLINNEQSMNARQMQMHGGPVGMNGRR